jgi:hypothetical protein
VGREEKIEMGKEVEAKKSRRGNWKRSSEISRKWI